MSGLVSELRNMFTFTSTSVVCVCHIGCQLYEKMISGMYLGEMVRKLLETLILEGQLFNGYCDSDDIAIPYRFYTKYVSEIET